MTVANRICNAALSSGSASVTFLSRYSYVEFKNESSSNPMYVRTDGTHASSASPTDNYLVGPGERVLIPNDAPIWYQGVPAADPSLDPAQASLGVPAENPGTNLTICGTGTDAFEVVGV